MGDALAGSKRCDRLSNPSDLPLVHIEIFVDGLRGKKCSAAPGALGELLKTLFGRAIYANRKCISVHMYTVYHNAGFAQHGFVFWRLALSTGGRSVGMLHQHMIDVFIVD